MEPSSSSKMTTSSLGSDSLDGSISSKGRRQKEKRLDTRHLLYSKHFSNYRLPVAVPSTHLNVVQLSRYESIADRERHPPLFVIPDQKSKWARLRKVHCPCHGCSCVLDPNEWLSHYLNVHLPKFGVSFTEVPFPIDKQTLRATCNVSTLNYDTNVLLGVYGYQRFGLNPLKCLRNTLLPKEYRKYSQHGVLLLFACRTRHSMLWQRNQSDDVIVFWVSTPLPSMSQSMRCVVQSPQSPRYYSKQMQARSLPTTMQKLTPCREFIKTDCNVIVIRYQDLLQLFPIKGGLQQLNLELHLMGERKV